MSSLHKQLSGSSQSHPSSQGKEEYWSRGAPGPGDLKQNKMGVRGGVRYSHWIWLLCDHRSTVQIKLVLQSECVLKYKKLIKSNIEFYNSLLK